MKLKYINKIKANLSIYSNKKTTNILDGTYKSVYKGKSMNFENLREYVINDDVKDIDWKSSARSGTLLVKQFIAEKKHNILFVIDTGKKMDADTDKLESKKELALYTAGTIGYIAIENGDYIGMLFSNDKKIDFKPFKYNLYNLESYLSCYERTANIDGVTINELLENVYSKLTKKMIIFIITDLEGLNNIEDDTLKKITQIHDVMLININDNYMFGENLYDISNNEYIPEIMLNDTKLNEIEKNIKNNLIEKNKEKLKKNKISMINLSSIKEINKQIIRLLEEHRYASNK